MALQQIGKRKEKKKKSSSDYCKAAVLIIKE
jgi:hypothetical protein